MRPIPDEMKVRFRFLLEAADAGLLFLVDCPELSTGRRALLVCEANLIHRSDDVDLLPIAVMIEGFPLDLYGPPEPDAKGFTVPLDSLIEHSARAR